MQTVEIILQHGWGFSSSAWKDWMNFSSERIAVRALDRGYFGQPHEIVDFGNAKVKLLVLHSLGLHLCPSSLLEQASHLAIVNSFQQFHPQAKADRLHSQKIIQRMKEKLEKDPEQLMMSFYGKCCTPEMDHALQWLQNENIANLDRSLLTLDLEMLDQNEFDFTSLKRLPENVLLLYADQDAIVPPDKTRELASCFPRASLACRKGSGHALPLLNSNWCLTTICTQLDISETLTHSTGGKGKH